MARLQVAAAMLPLVVVLAGCGLDLSRFPADPDGTLDQVERTGVLRAGAAPRPGWVELEGPESPAGREVELVEDYADHLGADVEWTVGTEEHLVDLIETGDLDLAVGGFTDANPWVEKVALTRPYVEVTAHGSAEKHAMMVPMGENALLTDLERWLAQHGSRGEGRKP